MLSKLKISGRVLLLGVLPLLMLLLVLLAAFWSAQQKDKLFNRLYDDHLAILSDVMAVQQILQQTALQDIRKYRTGWASAEATEQAVKQHLTLAQQHWQGFVQSRPAQDSAEFYAELDQSFDKAIKHYQEWISYAGSDALLVRILNESTVNNEIELRITAFTSLTEAFIQQQIAAGATVRDSAERFTTQLVNAYSVGGMVLLLLISGLIWAVQRSVCRPLWALRDMLKQVQQSSDLTLRANDSGSDEVAEAARALNQMISHFQQLVVSLGNRSALLTEQAASVFKSSDDVSLSVVRQADQANQLATAVGQMSASVQDVAAHAEDAAAAAQQAETLCAAGRDVAADSAAGISALAQQLQHSAQVVRQLQQESGQISGVLDVIGKISEQTNLLALNAAIEAARAGEAGRGFSVVADEVRTLSANTKQATESISKMISQLQQQAVSAVTVMQQAHKDADTNVQLAQTAGSRFTELATAVESIAATNLSICTATEQQQRVATDIAQNIQLLNDDVVQLNDGAARAADASEQLNQLAMQLSDDWRVFNVAATSA
ncbi:MAG: methyl-accepting chemotaxis protein [Gammaproteobacteria bacterium]|nr:methyl-accepting chemotaxis protein [Gammaproteobacteria bacterium]MBU1554535.1 methyl-accepting chemotaxis protein [Gammaproteobacteria bacterium]MBU2071039.1 methyl-accepting chemotaxis protein [Gammaproteobacteria bacterium]MBU2184307.1 methyl-accepting chemotaxis protein [Gammaproteobacteria bacterium]MBU2206436.1 methyl-accepting chemotaxis protein [Gammaproteobacteria bacterium]